jgi:hypothetical protein
MTTQPVMPNSTRPHRNEFFYPVTESAVRVLWPDHNAGWGLLVKLVGLVTVEVYDPDDAKKRIGIILGGTQLTDAELASRLGCNVRKLRYDKGVLSEVGLLLQRRYRSTYRLAIRCSAKTGRANNVDPKYSWVREAIGKARKLDQNRVEHDSHDPKHDSGNRIERDSCDVQPDSCDVQRDSLCRVGQQNQRDGSTDKIEEKREDKTEKPPPKSLLPDDGPDLSLALDEVWEHYLTATDRAPKLNTFTTIRRKSGLARLKECLAKTGDNLPNAVSLMKIAIDKLAASDFHMGRDPKTNGVKYNSWENNVFRSTEQMEGWWQR